MVDARGAMEQAIKEVETLSAYDCYRNSATNKIDFKEVVLYARDLLVIPLLKRVYKHSKVEDR